MLAPVVLDHKCVGCGLCQTRCYGINVKQGGLLAESAIIIEAGPGKEDRLMSGSYIGLREQEAAHKRALHSQQRSRTDSVAPETTEDQPSKDHPTDDSANPFGL